METFKQRLRRYTSQNDLEIFGWLTVYLQNDYRREIAAAREGRQYLSVYLLSHAVIQMISENLFGLSGREGTAFFLEHFVDDASGAVQFSPVAYEIHDARNVMAHQGYSSLQHRVEYFADDLPAAWSRHGETVQINPTIYAARFEVALIAHRWIKEYQSQAPGTRLVRKYRYIGQWLRLGKTDPLSVAIKALDEAADQDSLEADESAIQAMIAEKYGLVDGLAG